MLYGHSCKDIVDKLLFIILLIVKNDGSVEGQYQIFLKIKAQLLFSSEYLDSQLFKLVILYKYYAELKVSIYYASNRLNMIIQWNKVQDYSKLLNFGNCILLPFHFILNCHDLNPLPYK